MKFKDDKDLQKTIIEERASGKTMKDICRDHPEYSAVTYKRFLRGHKYPPREWTEDRRAEMSEIQKRSWETRDSAWKEKHEAHLRKLAESQRGRKIELSPGHLEKIRAHMASPKMKAIREKWNNRGKKTETPRQLKDKGEYEKTVNAQKRLSELGLTVTKLEVENYAQVEYKGHKWSQYWGGSPNATTFRLIKKVDSALAIQAAIDGGSSFSSACKANGVDPTSMARHLKFTGSFYEAVASIRTYERLLEIGGAVYNKRLRGLLVRPDILLEQNKLIIEIDGLFWHTEDHKEKKYHYERACLYEALGYKLLVFSQFEVENKRDIVNSMIENKTRKIPNRVGARECLCACLMPGAADEFFGQNHLKGAGSGRTLALIYGGNTVCALRYQEVDDEIHISRFCCLNHWSVTGAYSRLLSMLDPDKKIVNFVDRRHGDGKHLSDMGFVKENEHIGFEWTNGYEAFNRRTFLGDSGLKAGLKRYWDYGQIKWVRDAK